MSMLMINEIVNMNFYREVCLLFLFFLSCVRMQLRFFFSIFSKVAFPIELTNIEIRFFFFSLFAIFHGQHMAKTRSFFYIFFFFLDVLYFRLVYSFSIFTLLVQLIVCISFQRISKKREDENKIYRTNLQMFAPICFAEWLLFFCFFLLLLFSFYSAMVKYLSICCELCVCVYAVSLKHL